MSELTIHLGLHKTGTSYLQLAVYPRLRGISYRPGWDPLRSILLASAGCDKVLISDERLSGKFTRGAWMEQFRENADTLSRFFGEPSVIVGFRRHDRLLVSMYKQYLQEGGTGPVRELFNPTGGDGILKAGEWYFRDRLEYLDRLFPRIFVYTQEELRDAREELIGDLADFLGVAAPSLEKMDRSRKNVGVRGAFQARLLRRLNRIERRLQHTPLLPSLNNALFQKLRITPRRICQNRLSNVGTEPLALPDDIEEFMQANYREDWAYVNRRRRDRP